LTNKTESHYKQLTKENNMNTLTDGEQQAVDCIVSDAMEGNSHSYQLVYQTDDDAVFDSEQAADIYIGLIHILDNLEPLLLAPAFAAFINQNIGQD
jgi:hypothetical protein